MPCRYIEYKIEKVFGRVQMLSKTWYNLQIHIDSDFKKQDFSRLYCTRAGIHLLGQHTFATYFQKIFSKSLWMSVVSDTRNVLRNKKGRLTRYKVGFFLLNVQWWNFIDNVVFCNILNSIEAAFLELEKAMFTGATPVPIFTIITLGPYTHSKQSTAFHAKCNLKINCGKKWIR